MPDPVVWQIRDGKLTNTDGTLIMGVVNVTPDSFSDGGLFFDSASAIDHGLSLARRGADILDVGGESTRPGAAPVGSDEEARRTIPVVSALADEGYVVSIDTSKPEVAEAALDAGARIVNDVTALRDPAMAALVADSGAGVVLMHMLGDPRTMQDDPQYGDVVDDVKGFLMERVSTAEEAGIDASRICIDPGMGFGKTVAHNLALLAGLDRLVRTGYPVVVGTSRKSFLGELIGGLPVDQREMATAATTALAIAAGVAVVRVHDVERTRQVVRVADAIVRARR